MRGVGLCHLIDIAFDLGHTPFGKLFAFVGRTDMATVPWTVSCDPHKKTRGLTGGSNNALFKHLVHWTSVFYMNDPMIPSSLRICEKNIVTFLQRINPAQDWLTEVNADEIIRNAEEADIS